MKKFAVLVVTCIALFAGAATATASDQLEVAASLECTETTLGATEALLADVEYTPQSAKSAGEIGMQFEDDGTGSIGVVHEGDECPWTMQGMSVWGVGVGGDIVLVTCICFPPPIICRWSR